LVTTTPGATSQAPDSGSSILWVVVLTAAIALMAGIGITAALFVIKGKKKK
jgi:SNF family Na+-dependent transporter